MHFDPKYGESKCIGLLVVVVRYLEVRCYGIAVCGFSDPAVQFCQRVERLCTMLTNSQLYILGYEFEFKSIEMEVHYSAYG